MKIKNIITVLALATFLSACANKTNTEDKTVKDGTKVEENVKEDSKKQKMPRKKM